MTNIANTAGPVSFRGINVPIVYVGLNVQQDFWSTSKIVTLEFMFVNIKNIVIGELCYG